MMLKDILKLALVGLPILIPGSVNAMDEIESESKSQTPSSAAAGNDEKENELEILRRALEAAEQQKEFLLGENARHQTAFYTLYQKNERLQAAFITVHQTNDRLRDELDAEARIAQGLSEDLALTWQGARVLVKRLMSKQQSQHAASSESAKSAECSEIRGRIGKATGLTVGPKKPKKPRKSRRRSR